MLKNIMLMVRLSRVGEKKYATYKIVIQEKSKDPWDKALEYLGTYNPHTKELKVKKDRIEYWLSVGAQVSATVNNLLIKNKIIKGEKMKAAKLNKKKNGEGEKARKRRKKR
ncbi:30S ribosomal protein S16 [Candidatus Kuenenbacteria bacterium]|nr:30S ribosomal protein S16 [Candidatus Kuenenbacteria bacterium]